MGLLRARNMGSIAEEMGFRGFSRVDKDPLRTNVLKFKNFFQLFFVKWRPVEKAIRPLSIHNLSLSLAGLGLTSWEREKKRQESKQITFFSSNPKISLHTGREYFNGPNRKTQSLRKVEYFCLQYYYYSLSVFFSPPSLFPSLLLFLFSSLH